MSSSSSARRAAAILTAAGAAGAVGHLLPGVVAWRSARSRLLPGLSGVGRPGHVALTFDDGPDPRSTPLVMDVLEALGWHATFFCLGSQARRAPQVVRELVARGHEIGVHGDLHRSHLRRPIPSVVRDVEQARAILEDLTGRNVSWFRPPYGAVSTSSLAAARRSRLRMVLWTTWGLDWRAGATGTTVAGNVERTFVPGATVLLHDSDVTSTPGSWRATIDSLPLLAASWRDRGLEVGPLAEHF